MKTIKRPMLALALAAFALTACAEKVDPNSFGARLEREGGETAAIGKTWNDAKASIAEGRDMVAAGEKQVRKGENQIESGEDNVDTGQSKIAKGKRLISAGENKAAEAEAAYNARIGVAVPRLSTN